MNNSIMVSTNTQQCPLCGLANQCAIANKRNSAQCWCQQAQFSSELIARVPIATRNNVCICQACVDKAAKLTIDIIKANK